MYPIIIIIAIVIIKSTTKIIDIYVIIRQIRNNIKKYIFIGKKIIEKNSV
jgi:hypothetical protein